jgi:hypothetical protein
MSKFEGINRAYSSGDDYQSPEELQKKLDERMKEFLAKGGKVEKCAPGVAKLGVGSFDKGNKPRYTEAEIKKQWKLDNDVKK